MWTHVTECVWWGEVEETEELVCLDSLSEEQESGLD